jgi:hypothetical protein
LSITPLIYALSFFGFTLFAWFVPFYLSIFYYENIIFDLRHFDLRQLFQEHKWDFKQFTATLEIPQHTAVNEQWRSFGV